MIKKHYKAGEIEMLCSNCGKDIPFLGEVCPWCHKRKFGDQVVTMLGFIGFFVGLGIAFPIAGLNFLPGVGVTMAFCVGFTVLGAALKNRIEHPGKRVERPGTAVAQPPDDVPSMRCPECREQVRSDARRCKHCHAQLAA
jgi:RNA polymerase subunit RPABC4/transcription elongation factor Spt4